MRMVVVQYVTGSLLRSLSHFLHNSRATITPDNKRMVVVQHVTGSSLRSLSQFLHNSRATITPDSKRMVVVRLLLDLLSTLQRLVLQQDVHRM